MTGKSMARILIATLCLTPTVVVVFCTLILTCRSPHLFFGPQGALGPVTVTVTTFFFGTTFGAWIAAQTLPVGAARAATTTKVVTIFLSKDRPAAECTS